MAVYSPGDKVTFTLGGTRYTGTIIEPNQTGDDYLVKSANGTTWSVAGDALTLTGAKDQIPLGDILATVIAADGTAIAAVHDRVERCLDIACSTCAVPFKYRYRYSAGITDTVLAARLEDAAEAVKAHAGRYHTPRAATAGGQQP